MSVTQKEIVRQLHDAHYNADWLGLDDLADRIEREGIKPPEGYAIVPIDRTTGIAIDEGFIPAKFQTKGAKQ